MVAAIAALAIGLAHAEGPQALLGDWRAAGAIGTVLGWTVARGVNRRLAWHGAEGVLSAEALAPPPRRSFHMAGVALGAAAVIVAGLAARPDALILLLLGYAGGAALGLAIPAIGFKAPPFTKPAGNGRGTPLRAIAATQLPFGWSPAGGAVLLLSALAVGMAAWFASAWAPWLLAAGAAVPLLWLGRIDHAVVRFMALSGLDAGRSALLHLAAGGLYLGMVALVAAGVDPRGLVAVLMIGLGFGWYTAARVWAYRARPRRSADTMLVFMLVGAGLAAALLPPLLVVLLPYLGLRLYRAAAPATWSLA